MNDVSRIIGEMPFVALSFTLFNHSTLSQSVFGWVRSKIKISLQFQKLPASKSLSVNFLTWVISYLVNFHRQIASDRNICYRFINYFSVITCTSYISLLNCLEVMCNSSSRCKVTLVEEREGDCMILWMRIRTLP